METVGACAHPRTRLAACVAAEVGFLDGLGHRVLCESGVYRDFLVRLTFGFSGGLAGGWGVLAALGFGGLRDVMQIRLHLPCS